MYLYYFLSAFGPKMQPFLWWKKWDLFSNYFSDHFLRVVKISNDQITFPLVEKTSPFISFVFNFFFCCHLSPGDQIRSQRKQYKRNKSSSSNIAQVPHPSPNDPVCVRLHPRPPPSLLWLRLPKNHAKGDITFKESAVITIFRSWLPTPPSSLFFSPISISLPT